MAKPLGLRDIKAARAVSGLRPIAPVSLKTARGKAMVLPAPLAGQVLPVLEWVAPASLLVEDAYQRSLSEASLKMIRKIVASWNWAHVKPPICARFAEGRLCVIDGQHTAIAALTHGGIGKLPVVVVDPGPEAERARAFVAHNRDRLQLTKMQLHYAALAAGDAAAQAVNAACVAAGACILRAPTKDVRPGDTYAVAAIAELVKAHEGGGAADVLTILVDAARAPIKADEIKAAAALLHDRARPVEAAALAAVVKSETGEVWARLAASLAAERGVRAWQALADLWRAQTGGAPMPALAAASARNEPPPAHDETAEPRNGGGIAPPARRPVNASAAPPVRLPRVEDEVMRALAKGRADVATLAARTAYQGSAVLTALKALRHDGRATEVGGIWRAC